MGLIKCYECNSRVSTSADCCPNCGNTRFIEQRIEENKREELERRKEREEANENAKKLGYANASEKYRREEEARERVRKVKDIFGTILGSSVA